MSILEIPIGQKVYKIDCREEEAIKLQEFAAKLNMLINSKAVDLQMRVDNDYLLLLVCLDLLQENSAYIQDRPTPAAADLSDADMLNQQLPFGSEQSLGVPESNICRLSLEEQEQIQTLLNLLTSQLKQ